MRDIQKAIEEHKKKVLEYYSEEQILGIFVYGSQNYNLATDKSDVDTKAIIIPSLENLAIDPIKTKEIQINKEEHCEVMSIMHLIDNFKKQNINFIEILYTEYFWINPFYEKLWNYYFISFRDLISHYDINKAVISTSRQAIRTLKQNPLNGKKVGNGKRLFYFLNSYLAGKNYKDCIFITGELQKEILNIKYMELQSDKQALDLINSFTLIEGMHRNTKLETSKYSIDLIMNKGIMCLIRRYEHDYGKAISRSC